MTGITEFPQTLAAQTVVGNRRTIAGQAEAIPFTTFAADLLAATTVVVSSISALKALSGTALTGQVQALGYYASGDGGGGLFWWNSVDATTDNGGTIIAPNAGGTGRWNRLIDQSLIKAIWFGMSASATAAANTTAINAALALAKTITGPKTVEMPPGTFSINGFTPPGTSATAAISNGITLKGAGNGYQQQANPNSGIATTLKFSAGITSGLGSTKVYGIYQDNSKHWMNFEDFAIDGNSIVDYGLRICTQATYKRLRSTNCNTDGYLCQTLDSTYCENLVSVGNVGGGMLISQATSQDSVNVTPNTSSEILQSIFSGNGTVGLDVEQFLKGTITGVVQNNTSFGLRSKNQATLGWMQGCDIDLWLENNGGGVDKYQYLLDSFDASGGPSDNIFRGRIDPLSTNKTIHIVKGQRNKWLRSMHTNASTGAIDLDAGAFDTVFQNCINSDGTSINSKITNNGTRNYVYGEFTSPAFAAGNFTGGGSQTWTLQSGDVVVYKYMVRDKLMTLVWSLNTTTVGGVAGTDLRVAIPGGWVGAAGDSQADPFIYSDNNAAEAFGTSYTTAAAAYITLHKGASIQNTNGNWAASTNLTYAYGSKTFEVA